jgi:hypothetical protein
MGGYGVCVCADGTWARPYHEPFVHSGYLCKLTVFGIVLAMSIYFKTKIET